LTAPDRVPPTLPLFATAPRPGEGGTRASPVPSVRMRLVQLAAAVAAPLILLAAGSVWKSYHSERQRQEAALLGQARAAAAMVDREFESAIEALRVLAGSRALANRDLPAFEEEMRQASGRLGDALITATAGTGDIALSTSWPSGAPRAEARASPLVLGVLSSNREAVSDLEVGTTTHQQHVGVAVPVPSGDPARPAWVLSLYLPPERLRRDLDSLHLLQGWLAVIVDRQSRIVARSLDQATFIGRRPPEDLLAAAAKEDSGVVPGSHRASDGIPTLGAFARAPRTGYLAAVGVRESAFTAPLQAMLLRTSLAAALLAAMGIAGALLLSRRIVGALQRVAEAGPGQEATTGLREVDDLARAIAAADAQRRQTAEGFRLLAETIPGWVFITDAAGANLYVNTTFLEQTGMTGASLLGDGWVQLLHPNDRATVKATWREAVHNGRDYSIEYRVRMRDGAFRWFLVRARPLRDQAGQIIRWFGVAVDIADRRAAELALRQNEAMQRELLATIDLATVFVREMDGRIRFWSRGCERVFGWTAAEALGRSSHELLDVGFPIPLAEIEAHLLQHGEWEGELVHHRRDGATRLTSVRKVLRRGGGQQPPVVLETVADVTALREAEAKLRAVNQHLEARVRAEVDAREAAQARAAQGERLQALGQLAGGIAHDFNNVLQAMTGGATLIAQRAGNNEEIQRLARLVVEAGARGAAVTRRLLIFARRGDLRTEKLDAATVLEGIREILAPTLGRAIRVVIEAEPGLPALLADRGQLETVLVNLATNARDAMPHGGTVTMSARSERVTGEGHAAGLPPGAYVALAVADTGTGMDQATLARATEPFFSTKPPGVGTGLGLAMTRGFAEQSKGSMQIRSAPGRGTVVTIWLPVAGADAAPEAADDDDIAAQVARVLLVDDDDAVRESLAGGLSDLGLAVCTARSGEAALAMIREDALIDCLVTDLAMPEMNGIALIRAARASRPGLPAIVLTGYAGHPALADSAAGDEYTLMWKPANPAQIARRIAELLSDDTASGQPTKAAI
jgi:PAS domain S-box-containing protein